MGGICWGCFFYGGEGGRKKKIFGGRLVLDKTESESKSDGKRFRWSLR